MRAPPSPAVAGTSPAALPEVKRAPRALAASSASRAAGALLLLAQLALAAPAAADDLAAAKDGANAAPAAPATAVITGTVISAATEEPVVDVVIERSGPAGSSEVVVTDSYGHFRFSRVPPGRHTLRADADGYKPAQIVVEIGGERKLQANLRLAPLTPELPAPPRALAIDTGSSSTGLTVSPALLARLPLSPPLARGGAVRSFESVADLTPGARIDAYGASFNGATSPEDRYLIDGLPVNNPAFGINGTPLSIHFLDELRLLRGGYMPEYGRSTGGVLDAATRGSTRELHGAVWLDVVPGAAEGERRRAPVVDQAVQTEPRTDFIHQTGARLSGPIVRNRLYFFAGAALTVTRHLVEQSVHRRRFDPQQPVIDDAGVAHPELGNAFLLDEAGRPVTERVPGAEVVRPAVSRSVQYIGKLTWTPSYDHTLDLAVFGDQTRSGGGGEWGIDPVTSTIEGGIGDRDALSHRYVAEANDVLLHWQGRIAGALYVDASAGWHHQKAARLPSDGSAIGGEEGLAGRPSVIWRRRLPVPHDLKEFRAGLTAAQCADALVRDVDNDGDGDPDATVAREPQCPASGYLQGGPGFLDEQEMDRLHGSVKLTRLVRWLGPHVLKGGLDFEQTSYRHTAAYSGTVRYAENASGSALDEVRRYGFLTGPDAAVVQDARRSSTSSTMIGAFLQDSWSLLNRVTVNFGARYDAQILYGDGGRADMVLPFQLSPRAGVVYDFTRRGRSRLFANFARYHEAIPLDLADRSFPGESRIGGRYGAMSCDPGSPICPETTSRSLGRAFGAPFNPDQNRTSSGAARVPVDPGVQPQAVDEFVAGGEYELFQDALAGAVYTHTSLLHAIEDMSLDGGSSFFIGNPGSGVARRFPKAQRDYDGVSVYFSKGFSGGWLAQASYTLSFLRGNLAGLYRPETGQLDPNVTSELDLASLAVNRTGPLPGDRTHEIKVYAAGDLPFGWLFGGPRGMGLTVGLGYTGRSGAPTSFLAAHPTHGAGEAFLLPRGSGDRLPWTHSVDAHLQYDVGLRGRVITSVYLDVFNLFNFQDPIAVDENYTFASLAPIVGGAPVLGPGGKLVPDEAQLRAADGTTVSAAEVKNPAFGTPTAYQTPLTLRFGVKAAF